MCEPSPSPPSASGFHVRPRPVEHDRPLAAIAAGRRRILDTSIAENDRVELAPAPVPKTLRSPEARADAREHGSPAPWLGPPPYLSIRIVTRSVR